MALARRPHQVARHPQLPRPLIPLRVLLAHYIPAAADLEAVGEVGADLQRELRGRGNRAVVCDRQGLAQARADEPLDVDAQTILGQPGSVGCAMWEAVDQRPEPAI